MCVLAENVYCTHYARRSTLQRSIITDGIKQEGIMPKSQHIAHHTVAHTKHRSEDITHRTLHTTHDALHTTHYTLHTTHYIGMAKT